MHYRMHADDLAAAGLEHTPAVYQARFCALWCLADVVDHEDWVARLLVTEPDMRDPELARSALLALVEGTASALADDDCHWVLALPDDEDAPLPERVSALGAWCDAFVLGLAQAGLGQRPALAGEAREFVADLQAIARVDDTAASEEDEGALEELVEYVRMGVLVMKLECARASELH
jgi:uncharacterized protein YgfB (UPF0149 family)